MTGTVWLARLEAEAPHHQAFAEALEDLAEAISVFEIAGTARWRIEALFSVPPGPEVGIRLALAGARVGAAAPAVEMVPVPPIDWVAKVFDSLPPRRIGRFFVRGGHVRQPTPGGLIALHVEATSAFGSGEHETTQGCLTALQLLARKGHKPRHILDLGCGTGILGIAAAKLWPAARVLAADIDGDAVAATAEAALRNGVARRLTVRLADGPDKLAGRFDLVLANILARPLIWMAPALARKVAPGGGLVLAGLLAAQRVAVEHAYRARGLVLSGRVPVGVWPTLVFTRQQSI